MSQNYKLLWILKKVNDEDYYLNSQLSINNFSTVAYEIHVLQTIVALISRATSVSQFLYKATVTGAQEYHGWFYVKCNSCGKTRKVEACSYVCAHFNVPKEPNYRK
ncbi:hypothetical protein QVD17_30360 [Tagetes erecta]|uniref:Uncharacterized protein n=1 Tax=Tagetes erecta TaxID=13708 RepID=A0AAD8K582_TARER|nr:hypothetical protein QVD17_30360 [Tagetes erecta]